MTRRFDGRIHCPHCGKEHTQETAFERWVRNHNALDSRESGIVRFDCDVLLHKYLTDIDKKGTRDFQCVMFIEVKTHGATPLPAQQDTLSMFAQVLRNRRRNMHGLAKGRHAKNHCPLAKCWSHIQGREVSLRLFGGHLLQFEHESPEDDGWMAWDYKLINEAMLLRLLRFDLDPDTLRPTDWRRRYSDFRNQRDQKLLFTP